MVKNLSANAGDPGLISESGRYSGEGNGYIVRYSCWRIPRTEESMGSQRVGHDQGTNTFIFFFLQY